MDYAKLHSEFKCAEVQGRYVNLKNIEPILNRLNDTMQLDILGYSEQNRPIYKCQIGQGKTKILMWSQMHGNESTTTKGLLDFMNLLHDNGAFVQDILDDYTFCIIPMLNPDGAELYTRENANKVDLNRDFQNLTQAESRLLMEYYRHYKPDICFNLHDQRTVFGVGNTGKPATISFLAPSYNEARDFDEYRLKTVDVIMKMVSELENFIPEQIGRFDDSYNINCVGDVFQTLKTPTVLIEAGHFPDDYQREETRKFVFIALLAAFKSVKPHQTIKNNLSNYLNISQNIHNFYDIIYKNIKIRYVDSNIITNFAIQFKEELVDNTIEFNAKIVDIGNVDGFFGHFVYDAKEMEYSDDECNIPKFHMKANFYLNNNVKIVNGFIKK
ncbi:M14 metallopeptidase family protein [Flavobacterium sp.]|uniref:M14 family metallopeptidase n=1 Tax=Flavobacterium sp. TaxID=239 RepID=UPI00262778A5|nr:M14 metallopeptidase family protein [Flavobacterium sp.]MDD3004919.1 M14 family metallopeptidase [Flavobacterium sp.]